MATYDTPLFYTLQSSVEDDLVHKELWKYAVENENVVVEKVRMSNKAHMVIALAKEYYLLISESQVELCQGKDTTISLRVPSSNCSATLYASYWRQKLFKK